MAYAITFTTKHGTDYFGSFHTAEGAWAAWQNMDDGTVDRLDAEGITAIVDIEQIPTAGYLCDLQDLLDELANDWLTDEKEDA